MRRVHLMQYRRSLPAPISAIQFHLYFSFSHRRVSSCLFISKNCYRLAAWPLCLVLQSEPKVLCRASLWPSDVAIGTGRLWTHSSSAEFRYPPSHVLNSASSGKQMMDDAPIQNPPHSFSPHQAVHQQSFPSSVGVSTTLIHPPPPSTLTTCPLFLPRSSEWLAVSCFVIKIDGYCFPVSATC